MRILWEVKLKCGSRRVACDALRRDLEKFQTSLYVIQINRADQCQPPQSLPPGHRLAPRVRPCWQDESLGAQAKGPNPAQVGLNSSHTNSSNNVAATTFLTKHTGPTSIPVNLLMAQLWSSTVTNKACVSFGTRAKRSSQRRMSIRRKSMGPPRVTQW